MRQPTLTATDAWAVTAYNCASQREGGGGEGLALSGDQMSTAFRVSGESKNGVDQENWRES